MLSPSLPRKEQTLKKFRGKKYGVLVKVSPSGHRYCFRRDEEITAHYQGKYFPEDEAWMYELCGGKEGFLLEWANPPEGVKSTPLVEKPLTEADVFGDKEYPPTLSIPATRSQAQVNAELQLAGIEERNALRFGKKPEVVPEVTEDEDVPPLPSPEPPKSELFAEFETKWREADGALDSFVKQMKLEYKAGPLQTLCGEAGLLTEGTKAEMIKRLVNYFIEGK